MGFFNSLRNIIKWFTDKVGFSGHRGPTKCKHEEFEPINNKGVHMDESLVEILDITYESLSETDEVEITDESLSETDEVEITDESLSETDEEEITEPGSCTVPLRASTPVLLIEGRQHARRTMSPFNNRENLDIPE
ncbi:unnamed protein product [Macrosiphum euphorbiae]|uniref:Uncharacterized protein n=1 Tax=Macrosiphum euphorbiae TaxID=13131 RepID=A0AAV0XWN8_9HEMI|nr:unnamed protein product [Macrosiphum euphorbiae]